MKLWVAAVACLWLTVAGHVQVRAQPVAGGRAAADAPADADGWNRFAGTWDTTGHIDTLPTETGTDATILTLSGSVVLTVDSGLSRGFRGEVIGFHDGGERGTGRWVWTDAHGDRIFGTLAGEAVQTGRRVEAIITGGSGRYAGITGSYTFVWRYVVRSENNTVQGRAVGLEGRFRREATRP